jgi:signal transduction histidine kinase
MSRLFPLVAAFAAGSTILCGALLLLFNPRNRGIRWFTVFLANTAAWLVLLAFERDLPWSGWAALHPMLVHTLPATFLAFALVQALNRPAREPLALLLIAAITAPILGPRLWDRDKIAFLWQLANWVTGAAILARNYKRYLSLARGALGARAFGLTLVFPPLIVIGFLFLGKGFFFVSIPLMIVVAEFLTFVAVVRAQLYEIEVRAVQRGGLVADAAERERLAVVGELAASLAHEIRNPLTGVRSLMQRLTEENLDEPRRRRYATVVAEEIGRVERIVSDLLGLARRSRAGQAPVTEAALGDIVDDLILITAPRCQRDGLTLVHRVDVASQLVPREPLAQVLLNLLLNAVRHTRPGGKGVESRCASRIRDLESPKRTASGSSSHCTRRPTARGSGSPSCAASPAKWAGRSLLPTRPAEAPSSAFSCRSRNRYTVPRQSRRPRRPDDFVHARPRSRRRIGGALRDHGAAGDRGARRHCC